MLAVDSIDLYYGAAQALRSVSLSAKPGRVTCVMGRNGVGKTSLMRAICGHQTIAAGKIMWEGEDVSKLSPHARAKRGIAFVFATIGKKFASFGHLGTMCWCRCSSTPAPATSP